MENKSFSNFILLESDNLKHCFKIIKLFNLFLFVAIFTLNATNTFSQSVKVSLNKKNVKLEEVLIDIEHQTNYLFIYDDQVKVDQKVSINSNNEDISTVLTKLFDGSDINYLFKESHIILSKKEKSQSVNQAKTKRITGKIVDKDGETLIGINILIKGTTRGTTSDLDGNFSIEVSPDDILVFTYIGYNTEEIKVGNKDTIHLVMTEGGILLDDVVVTALGIKRETKTLTYNVQELTSEDLTIAKDINIMNSLSGKIAGVTINRSASGIGGSTRVVMRGTKSLQGNNTALYVLDGMPMISFRSKQSENFYEGEDEGDFEGISMLNPDDIESMSVLTGASAAALYGNKGASGVILITTKKGKEGKLRVNYSNNTSFSNPFIMPKFQNSYGKTPDPTTYSSWGEKYDNLTYKPKDFFQTSYTTMNSLSVSGGNELSTFHASASATNARGIVPNNDYKRYNFTLRNFTTLVKDVLTMDASLYYINQKDQNPAQANLYYNPIVPIYLFSPGDNINRYRTFETYDDSRNFKTQNWPYQDQALDGLKQNPFWITERNIFNNKRDRYMIGLGFNYKINDWLSASVRGRIDRLEMKNERKLYASTHTQFSGKYGNYRLVKGSNKNMYVDGLLTVDKSFGEDFRLIANLGGSFNDERAESIKLEGDLLEVANFFHLSNLEFSGSQFKKRQSGMHVRTNSMYATAQLGYKNFLFLDLTGRYDYFSTMEGSTNSTRAFYPSVGVSAVLSDILPLNKDIFSFMKVRASYALVGNPLSEYLTRTYYDLDGQTISTSSFRPAEDLKEEKTKSFEVGTDLKLWNNKIDLGLTYYNQTTDNQLIQYDIPAATTYLTQFINAGKVNNWGIELSLGYNQKLGPVDWYSNFTYTFNKNTIKELPSEVPDGFGKGGMMQAPDQYVVSDVDGVYQMILKEGGTMSDIYVQTVKKDPNDFVLVDPGTGAVQVDPTMVCVGQAAPRYNMGFRNEFSWKGLTLGFLIDARIGGVVVSSTQALLDQYGVSEKTAKERDLGGVWVNNGRVNPRQYYETVAGGKAGTALAEYTYSATNVRLRELSLSYKIPSSLFKNKLDMTISLTGQNLFMFHNKAPFDPELTSNTGTYYQGYDYFMQPSLRSFGFGVKIGF
ncbi:MAG: SusC/RagA family TonB-linked outer membrane protein [Bacteroidales bacterium]|nr:SusC/RagA family TonB-linked outer membrane protein [Bacteroidales bacterium]